MMIKRFLTLVVLVCLATYTTYAQTGKLQGQVTESIGPVPFANVLVSGTTKGALTDFDGNYKLDLPAGVYTIVVQSMGLISDKAEVTITVGQATTQNFALKADAELLDAVEIVAKIDRQSENMQLLEQKNTDAIVANVSSKEMSTKGISNVADGVAKISGVSKAGGNKLFVRGLGDRYNSASVNGLPTPSTNPGLKVIPLSIFPTDIVRNLSVAKTFDATKYADYAGASIGIYTKDYAEEDFLKIEVGTGMNTATTFNDFYTDKSGAVEFLGIDGGNRDLDIADPDRNKPEYYNNSGELKNKKYPYQSNSLPSVVTAAPNFNIAVSGGKLYELKDDKKLGFVFSLSTGNKSEFINTTVNRVYDFNALDVDYSTRNFVYSTNTTALLGVTYEFNSKNKIKANVLYVNDTENRTGQNYGFLLATGKTTYTTRSAYFVNQLATYQLEGDHEVNKQFSLQWGGSFSKAKAQEKDRKQFVLEQKSEEDFNWDYNRLETDFSLRTDQDGNNHRYWDKTDELGLGARINADYLFAENGEDFKGKLQFGYNVRYNSRDFVNRNFSFSRAKGFDNNFGYSEIEDRFSKEAFDENPMLGIDEVQNASTKYEASQFTNAGYVVGSYDITSELKAVLGVRAELFSQEIYYKEQFDLLTKKRRSTFKDTLNIFPSLSLKYKLNDKSNLRIAASQTVTRPKFLEFAPFQYTDISGASTFGNKDLNEGFNNNIDLKWESYPNAGELLSFTVYGKQLKNPIERVVEPSAGGVLYTYKNTGDGTVLGVELEVKKKLSNIIDTENNFINNLSVGVNAAYNYTKIVFDNKTFTSKERQLQGASPYLINADLIYKLKGENYNGSIALTYNVFGKRLYSAGTQGVADIFELPVNTLDLVLKTKIYEKYTVGLKFQNILNPTTTRVMDLTKSDVYNHLGDKAVVNEYKKGMTISFKIGYSF